MLNNLEGINNFPGTYNLSRQNHEKKKQTENVNRTMMSKDIKSIIKNLLKKNKVDDFMSDCHHLENDQFQIFSNSI